MTTAKYYIPSGRCIQAVEYNEGEPADIPDNKRTPFKTRNGRKVLDGGGVKPDLVLDHDSETDILQTLEEKNFVFNYVTEWILENPEVTDVETFSFNQWDSFVKFLEKKNFDFDTESENLLEKLKEQSKEDGYIKATDVSELEAKIVQAKKKDIESNKAAIIDLIEKEIASRFFYEKGRIQIGLRNDKEVKKAVNLFNDPAEYDRVLKGGK